jgi:hypothetical protein
MAPSGTQTSVEFAITKNHQYSILPSYVMTFLSSIFQPNLASVRPQALNEQNSWKPLEHMALSIRICGTSVTYLTFTACASHYYDAVEAGGQLATLAALSPVCAG